MLLLLRLLWRLLGDFRPGTCAASPYRLWVLLRTSRCLRGSLSYAPWITGFSQGFRVLLWLLRWLLRSKSCCFLPRTHSRAPERLCLCSCLCRLLGALPLISESLRPWALLLSTERRRMLLRLLILLTRLLQRFGPWTLLIYVGVPPNHGTTPPLVLLVTNKMAPEDQSHFN